MYTRDRNKYLKMQDAATFFDVLVRGPVFRRHTEIQGEGLFGSVVCYLLNEKSYRLSVLNGDQRKILLYI